MEKNQLIDLVKNLNTIDKTKLLGWLQALPSSELRIKPNTPDIGDVYMHNIFKHPYVLLGKKGKGWVCGILTSEPTCKEILEQCESRFFSKNYFTKILFVNNDIQGTFLGVYGNNKHLTKVKQELKKIFK